MADIAPFPAIRFNSAKVPLNQVVTQPYDKISAEMQERYYAANPHNLVRIILGKQEAGDSDVENVYTRAAGYFRDWQHAGIFRTDSQPGFYLYTQTFRVPGTGASGESSQVERTGLIAAGRIYDYSEGVVYRHEQTLSKPKADRLNLLRATRAHFGQIFMLYSDPAGRVNSLLKSAAGSGAGSGAPDIEIEDEYQVVHRVWSIFDPAIVPQVQREMADKRLIIADGHHRYETALNYRNERRANAGSAPPDAAYERVMMTLVNMDSPGLIILPTHRVIFGLSEFSEADFLQGAKSFFDVETLSPGDAGEDKLRQAGQAGTVFLAVTKQATHLLRARPGAADSLLAGMSAAQRSLDVVHLHKVLLERVLGISEEAIRNQLHVSYHRDFRKAIARVGDGANLAMMMNPVRISQLREVTFEGGVLPQKSTDFYPKMLSGLTIYSVGGE
ncbi:MAG TPA: DUF1015 domain-containing protein [Terriglobales bacterium]|nr:DUF1015 domain-containing protein [Terriglobales bacterium]